MIYDSHEALYDALAEIMVETVAAAQGGPATMILPVGPTLHYPVFARKVAEAGVDLSALRTFNMDEFLDRNGRTVAPDHPLSFRGEMMRLLGCEMLISGRMVVIVSVSDSVSPWTVLDHV